ncbi:hypothetical protein P4W37_004260, partial [Salmonella enterica]|nr:hypothetical protein [Salmonella enterica]
MKSDYSNDDSITNFFDSFKGRKLFKLPVEIEENQSLVSDFIEKCKAIKIHIEEHINNSNYENSSQLENCLDVFDSLERGISQTLEAFLSGDIKASYDKFEKMLKSKHTSIHLTNISTRLSAICNSETPLYRVRKSDNYLTKREEIFHIPFSQRHLVRNQRYSVAGLPCLYLGASLYVCWREMNRPDFNKLFVSAFYTSQTHPEEMILNLNIEALIDITSNFRNKNQPKNFKLALSLVALWPLILSCNYLNKQQDAIFIQEYVIPNLLMQWISRQAEHKIIGIAYHTTKIDSGYYGYKGLNVVFPPQINHSDVKRHDYCPHLAKQFVCTPPLSWQVLKSIEYIPERQSISSTEKLSKYLRRGKKWDI